MMSYRQTEMLMLFVEKEIIIFSDACHYVYFVMLSS